MLVYQVDEVVGEEGKERRVEERAWFCTGRDSKRSAEKGSGEPMTWSRAKQRLVETLVGRLVPTVVVIAFASNFFFAF